MVFAFGVDVPLVEFLVVLSIMNLIDLALIIYVVLKLRDELKVLHMGQELNRATNSAVSQEPLREPLEK